MMPHRALVFDPRDAEKYALEFTLHCSFCGAIPGMKCRAYREDLELWQERRRPHRPRRNKAEKLRREWAEQVAISKGEPADLAAPAQLVPMPPRPEPATKLLALIETIKRQNPEAYAAAETAIAAKP